MGARILLNTFQLIGLFAYLSTTGAEDVCQLPKESGPCRGAKPRFFFNSETRRCESFFYGGCAGNGNNFATLKECHNACKQHLEDPENMAIHLRGAHCQLPPISGLVACMAYFPKFTFSPTTFQCEKYVYGGCHGTANLYATLDECKASCLYGEVTPRFGGLSRPPVKPIQPKSRFMPMARSIGIGSGNSDDTNSPILLSPTLVILDETDICSLPPVNPHPFACSGFMRKWTYDGKVGSCVEYIYGGCHGTKNLFSTKEACEAKCVTSLTALEPKTPDVCGLSIDKGPCKALKYKFAFNKDTNRCEKFAYGGCQGNKNRFDSLEDCVNLCGGHEPQESLQCSAAVCNKQTAAFHRSKGCLPILKKGECCPSSWDCSAWENRLQNRDKCFWANEDIPRGKFYEPNDRVPEASGSGSCRMGCMCTDGYSGDAEIICAMPGCYLGPKRGEVCKNLYRDLNSCCASFMKCDDELKDLFTCKLDNTTYVAGEKMRPKEDPCKICLCNEGWTGETDDKEFCQTVDCGLGYHSSAKLKQGCQPIYREDACCPIAWACPEDENQDQIEPFTPEEETPPIAVSPMIICPPGVAIRPGDHLLPRLPPVEPLGQSTVVENRPSPVKKRSDVCLLPKTLGPCEGFEQAWYFDIESRKCHEFKTGGPDSGGNLFNTEAACMEACKEYALDTTSEQEECKYFSDDNVAVPLLMCLNEHRRFRFNRATGKCEDFLDWTCGRNPRGYVSMDECEANCVQHVDHENEVEETKIVGKADHCNLEPVVGTCRSRLGRFYYDPLTGKCKKFWYGGCQGNKNNFVDENDCIETCVPDDIVQRAKEPQDLNVHSACKQAGAVSGFCMAHIPRYYYDETRKICRLFYYGGCGGNDNNFPTLKECTTTCPIDEAAQKNHLDVCNLPRQIGSCIFPEKRYFYNAETFQCESFEYTGCGGDEGNFQELSNCQLECVLPRTVQTLEATGEYERDHDHDGHEGEGHESHEEADGEAGPADHHCLQEQVVGICRAAFRRFYFDKTTKECKKFIYGGCGGNENNFASLTQCETHCARFMRRSQKPKPQLSQRNAISVKSGGLPTNPVCLLPVEVGPCEALIPAFFFNTHSKKCEFFEYGGCRGNANRFNSMEECESACPRSAESVVLSKPADKCIFGEEKFNIGDLLRYSNNRCRTCKCISPPGFTCNEKICKAIRLIKTGNSICDPTYDEDGCCETGYTCRPKPDHPAVCSERICAMIDFIPPPNHTCTFLSDGCCQAGVMCIPNA